MIHELKIAPIYFEAVISGKKAFEVRKDDRKYQENDVLILKEYDNNAYTGREYAVIVTYILRGEYCKDGYCIMSIKHDNYQCRSFTKQSSLHILVQAQSILQKL